MILRLCRFKIILNFLFVNIELSDLTLLFRELCDLSLDLVLLLLQYDVFVSDICLSLLLQRHHLLLVLRLLVFQLLDVLVAFLHLIFAVFDFLLQLVIVGLEGFLVLVGLLECFLRALEVSFEIHYRLILVFQLPQQALLLQRILRYRFLLREFRRIEALVRLPEFLNFVLDQVNLMHLLRYLILFVFNVRLEVSPFVFQFACQFEDLGLQGSDLLGLLQDLLLHLPAALVRPQAIVLQFCFISCLHF